MSIVLLLIANNWKQPECQLTNKWRNNWRCSHMMEHYVAKKEINKEPSIDISNDMIASTVGSHRRRREGRSRLPLIFHVFLRLWNISLGCRHLKPKCLQRPPVEEAGRTWDKRGWGTSSWTARTPHRQRTHSPCPSIHCCWAKTALESPGLLIFQEKLKRWIFVWAPNFLLGKTLPVKIRTNLSLGRNCTEGCQHVPSLVPLSRPTTKI